MLPAAALLQKQGANKGAATAFLISTPESGVDSIAITYALLDPIMTVARPVAAFLTAIFAGLLENYLNWQEQDGAAHSRSGSAVDAPEKEENLPADEPHRSFSAKLAMALRYAVTEVWGEIALWYFIGLVIAALITVFVPDALMVKFLGGGLGSMLIMLLIGIPLYICATASTPIAAALILKGVSPGAALVFLLAGPATNMTSLSVLIGLLGRKSALRYLVVLAVAAVLFGLGVDQLYAYLHLSPRAIIGEAAELVPLPAKIAAVFVLAVFSVRPIYNQFRRALVRKPKETRFVAAFPDLSGKMGSMPFPPGGVSSAKSSDMKKSKGAKSG